MIVLEFLDLMVEKREHVLIFGLGCFCPLSEVELYFEGLYSFDCFEIIDEAQDVFWQFVLIEFGLSESSI